MPNFFCFDKSDIVNGNCISCALTLRFCILVTVVLSCLDPYNGDDFGSFE